MEVPHIIILAGVIAAVVAWIFRAHTRAMERQAREQEAAERQRLEDCGRLVLFFANHLGYIARQCISREELEERIDAGFTAQELGAEIGRRIQAIDGLVLGYQDFADARVPVKLTQDFRDRHVYVIGKSGSGKTNLLRNLIVQDLAAGNGLAILAPEAEMITEEILPFIPDDRLDDVIYFNPADTNCPVPFNPLALEEDEDIDVKVDENLTIFKRVMGETGPRMDEILRQALYALVGRPGATFLDMIRLLDRTDDHFRREVIGTCPDTEVAKFWENVYPTFPKDAHLPITNRLGRFLHAKTIRNMLCSTREGVNFGRAMDEGKIMLFNLSDGLLGEQNSQILGQLVVSKFQLAVMARARQEKRHRKPFYLYLDEFQTFTGTAGASYEKMLSRARKYRLGLVLAHQQTGQIPTDLLHEILGNVSTTICFQVSAEDARKFSRELVTEYDGEVVNVSAEDILRLRVGEAMCKMGNHTFLMHTFLAPERESLRRAHSIVELARKNYGRPLLPAAEGVPAPIKDSLRGLDPTKVFED